MKLDEEIYQERKLCTKALFLATRERKRVKEWEVVVKYLSKVSSWYIQMINLQEGKVHTTMKDCHYTPNGFSIKDIGIHETQSNPHTSQAGIS
jgi:hypothetical protein